MIDKFDKLQTAVDPTIVDVEVTETILKCSNSNNDRTEPTNEKDDGNLSYLLFNLLLIIYKLLINNLLTDPTYIIFF